MSRSCACAVIVLVVQWSGALGRPVVQNPFATAKVVNQEVEVVCEYLNGECIPDFPTVVHMMEEHRAELPAYGATILSIMEKCVNRTTPGACAAAGCDWVGRYCLASRDDPDYQAFVAKCDGGDASEACQQYTALMKCRTYRHGSSCDGDSHCEWLSYKGSMHYCAVKVEAALDFSVGKKGTPLREMVDDAYVECGQKIRSECSPE